MPRIRWQDVLRAIEPYPSENFKLKAVALGLSLILWGALNSEDPWPHNISNVPIELVNVPPDLAIADQYEHEVTVSVRGPESRVGDLSAGALRPQVDLSQAHRGINTIYLTPDIVNVPFGVQVERITPSEIRLPLEQRVEASVPIAAVTQGEPAQGYEVVSKSLDPPRAGVVGPASRVEDLPSVQTSIVDVSGLRESMRQRVTLLTGDPFVELRETREAQLTIEIREVPVERQYDGIQIEVVNSPYSVAVNPDVLSVVVSAPPSTLETVSAANLRAVIDAQGLQPQGREDYLLQPSIVFEPVSLAQRITVVRLIPQQRVNVHVYPGPRQ